MELLLLLLLLAAAALAVRILSRSAANRRVAGLVELPALAGPIQNEHQGKLALYLLRAGYRNPSAPARFAAATAATSAIGLAGAYAMIRLGMVATMADALESIPGAVGEGLAAVAAVAPYIFFVILAVAPWMVVRAARRKRVEAIEQDMPSALELLATLAEAGLALDSAIARISESEHQGRPLSQEFQIYQRDLLGGITRLDALRAFAHRLDVTSVTIFVSALIQSEQVGASLSETLRGQADELRDRRKLRALVLAQALPVKLTFPLIACFLPGIFFVILGPVFNQLVDVVDSIIRRR